MGIIRTDGPAGHDYNWYVVVCLPTSSGPRAGARFAPVKAVHALLIVRAPYCWMFGEMVYRFRGATSVIGERGCKGEEVGEREFEGGG